MKNFILTFLLISLSFFNLKAAGELQLLMSSRINVEDINDFQFQSCDSYLFGEKMLFDNPNQLALFQNQAYLLGLNFTAFFENKEIESANYVSAGIRVDVFPREKATYKIKAISSLNGKVVIDLNVFGAIGQIDTLNVQLWDKNDKLFAEAIFPFQVYDASGDFSGMALLPYMIQIEPAYVILTDQSNTNNVIQQQASVMNDPLILKKGKSYDFEFEIEKSVTIDGEEYVVIANQQNSYGYEIRYSWDQPLLFKTAQDGFTGILKIVPDGKSRPKRPLWVDGNMSSLLPAKGKRTVQYVKFYQNDPKQEKQYVNPGNIRLINQRKRMAAVVNSNFITNFQNADLSSIEKISPRSANLKTELLKGSTFVVVEPKKSILQMEKVNTRYYFENNGNVKAQLMVPMQRMQIVTPQVTTPAKKPANTTIRQNKNLQMQKTERVAPTNTQINSKSAMRSRTLTQNARVAAPVITATPDDKASNLHTLYIEACRGTDYLNCRPFQITFQLVD